MERNKTWLRLLLMALLALAMTAMVACGNDDDDDDDTNDDDDTGCTLTADDCEAGEVFNAADCSCDPQADDDDTGNDDDTGDDDDTPCANACDPESLDAYDLSCLGSNDDPAPTGTDVTLSGYIYDFMDDIPVGGATVKLVGTAEEAVTAANGTFTLTVPGNERINLQITTDGGWVETWQYNVFTSDADYEDDFPSVSETAMVVVPGIAGVQQLPGNGGIAGTASDCAGEEMEGFVVHASPCNGAVIRYFQGGIPNGDRCPSNDDGLYVVLNADPGVNAAAPIDDRAEMLIEIVGLVDGNETVIASHTVKIIPDGLGILNFDPE